ncbi:MAG: caspase family protein [Leptolyngbya sp. SIO1D8]|nr:caspase family protein [Leptolyngbya sp. SIO1D8]
MVKRAVVVGVNDYSIQDPSGNSLSDLNCCVRDAQSTYHLLINAFGFDPSQVFYYTDRQASRDNILRSLRYITANGEAGDVACFYYSGHGARIPAKRGKADCDKYLEAIVPASGDWITDWELFRLAQDLEPSAVNFTVVLDSCHSGGLHETDQLQKCRSGLFSEELIEAMVTYMQTLVPCGVCLPPTSDVLNHNVSQVTANSNSHNGMVDLDEDPDKTLIQQSKSTLISGCRFNEYSWEDGDTRHSLLTQSLLDLVNQSNFEINHHDLIDELRQRVAKKITTQIHPDYPNATQTPQLRGQMNRMEENFLAGWIDSR